MQQLIKNKYLHYIGVFYMNNMENKLISALIIYEILPFLALMTLRVGKMHKLFEMQIRERDSK
jgi:hypothetical protein